jgi:hypothetical protein
MSEIVVVAWGVPETLKAGVLEANPLLKIAKLPDPVAFTNHNLVVEAVATVSQPVLVALVKLRPTMVEEFIYSCELEA